MSSEVTRHSLRMIVRHKRAGGLRNIIGAVMGDIGAGKTLYMTILGLHAYLKGFVIISNYHLAYPHFRIEKISDIDEITENTTYPYVFLFDEPFTSIDARESQSKRNIQMSHRILQSRKKRVHIFYSVRYQKEIELRMRVVTNWVYFPHIVLTLDDNTPYAMLIERFKRNRAGEMIKKGQFPIKTFYHGYNLCEMYDTSEIVKVLQQKKELPLDMDESTIKFYLGLIDQYHLTKGETMAKISADFTQYSTSKIKEMTDYLFMRHKINSL